MMNHLPLRDCMEGVGETESVIFSLCESATSPSAQRFGAFFFSLVCSSLDLVPYKISLFIVLSASPHKGTCQVRPSFEQTLTGEKCSVFYLHTSEASMSAVVPVADLSFIFSMQGWRAEQCNPAECMFSRPYSQKHWLDAKLIGRAAGFKSASLLGGLWGHFPSPAWRQRPPVSWDCTCPQTDASSEPSWWGRTPPAWPLTYRVLSEG